MTTANPRAGLTAEAAAAEAAAAEPRFSVLFVDDDPIARGAAVCHWSGDDCSIEVVRDGAEACLALNSRPYDVMVLDLSMPKFDGFDVLKYARSDAAHRNLPIVVLTSRSDEETRKQARDEGATLFYTKPTDWTALKHQLWALVSAGRSTASAGEPAREQRAHLREEVIRRAVVVHQTTGDSFPCLILEVSEGGARLQLLSPDLPAEGLALVDAASGAVHGLRVMWRMGPLVGVAFTGTASPRP